MERLYSHSDRKSDVFAAVIPGKSERVIFFILSPLLMASAEASCEPVRLLIIN